jgi:hypothetical protein
MERLVQITLARELRETEREPRVRDDCRPVVLEPERREPVAQWIALADADAVAPVELCERDPLGRVLRVEVEREPDDVGVELAPGLLGRDLAEPAERSDVVAPDQDRVFRHHVSNVGCRRSDSRDDISPHRLRSARGSGDELAGLPARQLPRASAQRAESPRSATFGAVPQNGCASTATRLGGPLDESSEPVRR